MRFKGLNREIIVVSAAMFLVFIFDNSSAVDSKKGKIRLTIGAGFGFPLNPPGFQNYWDLGFGGSVGLERTIGKLYQLRGLIEYHKFPNTAVKTYGPYLDSEGEILIYGASVSGKLMIPNMPQSMRSYFTAGLGLNRIIKRDLAYHSQYGYAVFYGYDQFGFQITLGHGFEIPISGKINFYIEGRFTLILQDGDDLQYLPVFFGFKG